MTRQYRIAIIIDLEWAFQHHHGVFVGTQRFARQQVNWECLVMPSLERGLLPLQKGQKFQKWQPSVDGRHDLLSHFMCGRARVPEFKVPSNALNLFSVIPFLPDTSSISGVINHSAGFATSSAPPEPLRASNKSNASRRIASLLRL